MSWRECLSDRLFQLAGGCVWVGIRCYRLARRVRYGDDESAIKAELIDG